METSLYAPRWFALCFPVTSQHQSNLLLPGCEDDGAQYHPYFPAYKLVSISTIHSWKHYTSKWFSKRNIVMCMSSFDSFFLNTEGDQLQWRRLDGVRSVLIRKKSQVCGSKQRVVGHSILSDHFWNDHQSQKVTRGEIIWALLKHNRCSEHA